MNRKSHPRWRADVALIGICFIWGSTFVMVKEALADASTLVFLAVRFVLAAAVLAIAFLPRRSSRLKQTPAGGGSPKAFLHPDADLLAEARLHPAACATLEEASALETAHRRIRGILLRNPALTAGVLVGFFLFLGYAFQTVGLRYTTPSKSAFLTGLSVVMVPVFAAVFNRRVPGLWEAVGVGVATVGMALMTLRLDRLSIDAGDLLTLGCAAAFAVHILLVGHFAPKLGFQALATGQITAAAIFALGTFWWIETPFVRWTPGLITALLVTGLLATALAFSVQTWAQQYTTPTRTALIFAMEPVFAWLTSFALTGELLSPSATAGAFLILAGILLVELKPAALRR